MEPRLLGLDDGLHRRAGRAEANGPVPRDCEKYDILCDSFHLSSGYTSIGDKRYVFT